MKQEFHRTEVIKLLGVLMLLNSQDQDPAGSCFADKALNILQAYEKTKGRLDEYTTLATLGEVVIK